MAISLLLAGTVCPAHASTSDSTELAEQAPPPASEQPQDIIVTGNFLFRDVAPEANLDQDAIDSFGVSTVDELVNEVQGQFGDEEPPLILINGERTDSLEDIGQYPVEVLRNVQVLPRGSAVRVGGSTGQRVISLTLQRKMRAATLTGARKIATAGDWHGDRGEAILTYVQGPTRANLSFRARDDSSLLESERGIIQPPGQPFAIGGNVVGYPDTAGEIDPQLSALFGEVVTVAAIPAATNPALADFEAVANQANSTNVGEYRTLWPKARSYEFGGNATTRLAPWLTSSATVQFSRNRSDSLRGLPGALFLLSSANGASPFTTDVGLLFYEADALRSRTRRDYGSGRIAFNARFGKWVSLYDIQHADTKSVTDTDRRSGFGEIALDDGINPFATDVTALIPLTTDRATYRNPATLTRLSFTGPAAALPAGDLRTTIEGRLAWNSIRSSNSFSVAGGNSRFSRSEQSIRGAVEIPLTSRSAEILPQVGDITGTAEYALLHYSDAGSLDRYGFGLTWEPVAPLRLRASIEGDDHPAPMQILGSPIIVTPQVRTFDPLTGETVDVVQTTGGNPDIRPEKNRIFRLSALVRLLPRLNLQLNSEYTDLNSRNFISYLPPASLPVMLAFPDRYVRDSDGRLTRADLRPVNFDSHREKRLRWGFSMRSKLSSGSLGARAAPAAPPEAEGSEDSSAALPPVASSGVRPASYLELSANHHVIFSDKLFIRPGLDSVDLLGGGAIGIGGGRVRHQIDGTAAFTSGGIGARLDAAWRGKSSLDTSINGVSDTLRFDSLFILNLRLFADSRRLIPNAQWARGLRLSINMLNVTNDRQRVRDSFGNTPLQYQPAYRDPIGRTIEFEIRKVF